MHSSTSALIKKEKMRNLQATVVVFDKEITFIWVCQIKSFLL